MNDYLMSSLCEKNILYAVTLSFNVFLQWYLVPMLCYQQQSNNFMKHRQVTNLLQKQLLQIMMIIIYELKRIQMRIYYLINDFYRISLSIFFVFVLIIIICFLFVALYVLCFYCLSLKPFQCVFLFSGVYHYIFCFCCFCFM